MPTTEQVAGIFISDIIPLMTIDEFQKMDLRVGKIISAERVEGSEKLLKLQVDIGEIRQILSGIAKTHAPEELVGREVVIIANLDPRNDDGHGKPGNDPCGARRERRTGYPCAGA